ncbi:MAG: hypothetical protein ACLFPH_11035 [Bacteroidales bacterium]
MKRINKILYLFVVFSFFFLTHLDNSMAQEKTKILSWIEKDTVAGDFIFQAYFQNESPEMINELSYEFYGKKHGKSGRSNVKQSGEFEASPEEKILLAKIEFNSNNKVNENINLTLKIFHNKNLIAIDTLSYKP